jgi:hypothetical protein
MMTKQELTIKLNAILEGYEERITEVEQHKRKITPGVHPSFFSGQLEILVTVCTDLEALVLEAIGQPLPPEHSAIVDLAERQEKAVRAC